SLVARPVSRRAVGWSVDPVSPCDQAPLRPHKKHRVETHRLRPCFTFDLTGDNSAPRLVPTSMFARPLGFLDRGFVVPGAAAIDLTDARRLDLDRRGNLGAARPARAGPHGKLVDLCRSVMEARVHDRLSC